MSLCPICRSASTVGFRSAEDGILATNAASELKTVYANDRLWEFADADTDGDGQLSFAECQVKGMTRATFEKIDADGNGNISVAEFQASAEASVSTKLAYFHILNKGGELTKMPYSDDDNVAIAGAKARGETAVRPVIGFLAFHCVLLAAPSQRTGLR